MGKEFFRRTLLMIGSAGTRSSSHKGERSMGQRGAWCNAWWMHSKQNVCVQVIVVVGSVKGVLISREFSVFHFREQGTTY